MRYGEIYRFQIVSNIQAFVNIDLVQSKSPILCSVAMLSQVDSPLTGIMTPKINSATFPEFDRATWGLVTSDICLNR